jgi:uncharacterized protein (DUF58 family)
MGAFVELQDLVKLQYKAKGFSFLPRQPIHSLLSGRHSSRIRGRGLDFEELRGYLPGDDIRTMDWHVTARMQKPFVRVYTEERDRPAIIAVDQRINMFFGSRLSTKSVVAAEVAALAAWRVFRQGDRIGALIFSDSDVKEVKPHRSRSTIMRILEQTVEQNRLLSAGSPARSNSGMLNDVLGRIARVAPHDSTVLIVSDFDGVDQRTDHLLMHLAQHNEVIAAFVYDPFFSSLPAAGDLVVTDGDLQAELQFSRERIRKSLHEASDRRTGEVLSWQKRFQIPVLPISAAEDTAGQIRRLLGQAVARRQQ